MNCVLCACLILHCYKQALVANLVIFFHLPMVECEILFLISCMSLTDLPDCRFYMAGCGRCHNGYDFIIR